jgi:IS605 OrfB family transposase
MRVKSTLVVDYGRVKQERQRYHIITTRCQERGKASIHRKIGANEERFIGWVLHRFSRAVVEFAEQFSNSFIVFEDMSGIRGEIKHGTYMNRRLHKLPSTSSRSSSRTRRRGERSPLIRRMPITTRRRVRALVGVGMARTAVRMSE